MIWIIIIVVIACGIVYFNYFSTMRDSNSVDKNEEVKNHEEVYPPKEGFGSVDKNEEVKNHGEARPPEEGFGSVDKYGGLKNKYAVFISKILKRNSFYSLHERNLNYVEITNIGILFTLKEINKELIVTWYWESFTTGKTYEIKWSFGENEDPEKMYRQVDKDIKIQNMIDSGMTRLEAVNYYKNTYES